MPNQPTASRARARSVGCVIIASWGASKSTTSQPAVSRRRTAKPEKLGGQRALGAAHVLARQAAAATAPTAAASRSAAAGRSNGPTSQSARPGDPEDLGRRRRRDQPVDGRLVVDLAPLRAQQVEHRLAVLGDERVQEDQPRDPRVRTRRRARDHRARRRSGRPGRPRAGPRSTGDPRAPRRGRTVDAEPTTPRVRRRRTTSARARRGPRRTQLSGDVAPAPTAVPRAVDEHEGGHRVRYSASCWYAIDWNDIRCSGETPSFSIAARCSGVE